jgi:hypothetical protein
MKKSTSRFFIFLLFTVVLFQIHAQKQDGIIEPNEYPFKAEFNGGDFLLHWNVTGNNFAAAIEAATTGWVALGIDPLVVMDKADMIFGWVDAKDKVFALDCFSVAMFGPHPPDTDLGGKDDIISFGGSEKNGKTVFEFLRPLNTGDPYDKPITSDRELAIIWAYGNTDDFEDIHSAAGSARINITAGTSKTKINLLFPHIAFMTLSFLSMLTGIVIARYFRAKKWWLKIHRPLGVSAGVFGVLGLVFGFLLVATSSGIHLRVPHSWSGFITLVFVGAAPILGQAFLKSKIHKKTLRELHRWAGRGAALLMAVTAILGMYQAGIL